ncbi:MAG: hypothetical protein HC788_04535 [Sphingopyxis sp.]|nr:hypothetical protein [Sphingopyxis sp.]
MEPKDIKYHKWFTPINWIAVYEKRIRAPHIPKADKDHYEKYDEKPIHNASTDLFVAEFESF